MANAIEARQMLTAMFGRIEVRRENEGDLLPIATSLATDSVKPPGMCNGVWLRG